jgi:hypothetical protein
MFAPGTGGLHHIDFDRGHLLSASQINDDHAWSATAATGSTTTTPVAVTNQATPAMANYTTST